MRVKCKCVCARACAYCCRGGWNAVDSITRFGWSGSAVLGGFLVDRYSYGANFLVTGIFLGVAACLWPLLFHLVDASPTTTSAAAKGLEGGGFDEQGARAGGGARGASSSSSSSSSSPSRRVYSPLLDNDEKGPLEDGPAGTKN
jgi:hypothetical protein